MNPINRAVVVVAEGGIIDEANGLAGDVKTLLVTVVGALALAFIIMHVFQKRTITAVIIAAAGAALFYWIAALGGVETIANMFKIEFSDSSSSIVRVVEPPEAPGVVVL